MNKLFRPIFVIASALVLGAGTAAAYDCVYIESFMNPSMSMGFGVKCYQVDKKMGVPVWKCCG